MQKRSVLYVSGSRADYGPARDLLRAIQIHPNLELGLLVTAMHLQPEHGMTVGEIEKDGFNIVARVPTLSDASLVLMSEAVGDAVARFGQEMERLSPDLLLLLGDRAEQLSAAVAGAIQNVTIVHLCGGSNSGSIDNSFRHAISKFAHYHFPANEAHAKRLVQMGEAPDTIEIVGLPGGNLSKYITYSGMEIKEMYGLPQAKPYLLVLQHPVTHSHDHAGRQIVETLEAVVEIGLPTLLANPNGDPGGTAMQAVMNEFASEHENLQLLPPPGSREIFASVMGHCTVLVGNSSSAVGEAMSVGLPVVNIGDRQQGREADAEWINVDYERGKIADGIRFALTDREYRGRLEHLAETMAWAAQEERTAGLLAELDLSRGARSKRFFDLDVVDEFFLKKGAVKQCIS